MPDLRQYLKNFEEPDPDWLFEVTNSNRQEIVGHFLSSRTLFYPGSGTDGGPIESFNNAHACHCFIYVDYGVARTDIFNQVQNTIRGYRSVAHFELTMSDLTPQGWTPSIEHRPKTEPLVKLVEPYAFIEILERSPSENAQHGAHRFALLCLGADGFGTFDALFCQHGSWRRPWCVVVQDHGFGGNYDKFGGGGILEQLASSASVMPELLLVADNSEAWTGYSQATNVQPECMGQHAHERYLWERSN